MHRVGGDPSDTRSTRHLDGPRNALLLAMKRCSRISIQISGNKQSHRSVIVQDFSPAVIVQG
jgi:hypothetical protein